MHAELGLSAAECAEGFILTCVRKAQGPVELEIDDLGDLRIPETKTLPCRIHSLERVGRDVLKVTLRLPPSSKLEFLPGQYVDIIGAGGLRRSYSMANAMRDDQQIEIHVKEVEGGAMSRYWFHEAKTNDLLRLRGPLGTFFLRGQAGKNLVFLATGTGIAPVKAIIEGLAEAPTEQQPRSMSVYWGGRFETELYWQPPPLEGLRFTPVLSRADALWNGARGHVQDVMLREHGDLSDVLVYACGADAMIRSAKLRLDAAGLPQNRFRSDAFVCSATA